MEQIDQFFYNISLFSPLPQISKLLEGCNQIFVGDIKPFVILTVLRRSV